MKALLKYKIGFAVLILLTIGLVVVVVLQSGDAKQDTQTFKAANDIAAKLNNYTLSKNTIPASLGAAGIRNVPATIQYKKLSSTKYRFCEVYKDASSDFYSSGIQGVVDVSGGSPIDDIDGGGSLGELSISTQHHAGSNCQTVTAAVYSPAPPDPAQSATASGEQSSACGQDKFLTHYSGTITSIHTTDGSPIVPTADQPVAVIIKPTGSSPKGLQTLSIDQSSDDLAEVFNVYNGDCTGQEVSTMQVGDNVSVFLDNNQPYMPNALIDFSQN